MTSLLGDAPRHLDAPEDGALNGDCSGFHLAGGLSESARRGCRPVDVVGVVAREFAVVDVLMIGRLSSCAIPLCCRTGQPLPWQVYLLLNTPAFTGRNNRA
jgi:hypothetical protein